MVKHPKKLLVIFAEAALERRLVSDAARLGAHGYTVWDVRGASGLGGSSAHQREGAWDADRTIEMKIICDPAVADAIAEHVLAAYGQHYSVALYFADVEVARPAKF